MEAALVAMAAHTLIMSPPHISSNPHHPPPLLRSSSSSSSYFLRGPFLKLPRQSLNFSLSAKPLTIVSAKKAVAVLKGTSSVEGVVTLTQEDNGLCSSLPSFIVGFFMYNSLSGC
jgi:Cu-Zn family superoxide dismutase